MSTANGFECQIRNSAETMRIERVAERKDNLLPTLRDSTRNDKAGEHDYEVPALRLPSAEDRPSPEELGRYEGIRLFMQRAQAANSRFTITTENAPAVVELCRQLDGLPLAIEHAAARANVLPAEAMVARLGNRFGLLTGGARDLPDRHRTLRATLDWSYDLLSDTEHLLFAWLAVFAGAGPWRRRKPCATSATRRKCWSTCPRSWRRAWCNNEPALGTNPGS